MVSLVRELRIAVMRLYPSLILRGDSRDIVFLDEPKRILEEQQVSIAIS